jgi:pantoate--beta-alanine ligase
MHLIHDIAPLSEELRPRRDHGPIVLVPTMGALHDGHAACVQLAQSIPSATVVVSVFVNPTQFAPGEDLTRYPRPLEADLELCESWKVDLVFAPSEHVMYKKPQQVWVEVDGLTDVMCGDVRPGHFRGVTTVVTKLFNIVRPDIAVFGQKDAQQALVIHEMINQMNMDVELKVARTVRESDGLAISSRNKFLNVTERSRASGVHGALMAAAGVIRSGERNVDRVLDAARLLLAEGGVDDIEYVELRSAVDLSALGQIEGRVILAVAVRIGAARLIDNIVLDVESNDAADNNRGRVEVDVALF